MNFAAMKNSDWLANLLKKTRLSPLGAGFLVLVINIVVDFTLAFTFGGLFPSQQSHGLLREPIAITSDLLVSSVLVGYYVWIQSAFPRIFETLISEKIITWDEAIDHIINRYASLLNAPSVYGMLLIISIVGGLSFTLSIPGAGTAYVGWVSVHPIIPWVRSLFNVLSIYVALILIFDLAVLLFTFSQIFRLENIVVKPSHPDRAGGLGVIGRFTANLGYLIGAFGLLVSVSLLSNTLSNGIVSFGFFFVTKVLGAILYIIVAPIVFFVPLYSAHQAMLRFRNKFLLEIGTEIDQEYSKIQTSYKVLEPTDLEKITKRISYFRELNAQVREFPVWPFNPQNIRKFFAFVIGAILPGLTSIAFDMIGIWIK